MTNLSAPAAIADQAEAILQVFQAANPLTVPQAEKLYLQAGGQKLKKNEFRQIVENQLLMQGQLFKCSPSGKSLRYWTQDEAEKVRDKVEELLTGQDLDEKKLATAVNKALPKISSPAAIKGHIQTMRREGLVHERPGKGKTKVLSREPFDPRTAISFKAATLKDLSAVLAKVESLGVGLDQFLEVLREHLQTSVPASGTPVQRPRDEQQHKDEPNGLRTDDSVRVDKIEPLTSQVEIDELILKGMYDLEPAVDQGASVLLRNLRRHMPPEYRGHDTFDAAVFRLADQEKIVLHRDDQPASLTDEERDELICEEGIYYISIAKRV